MLKCQKKYIVYINSEVRAIIDRRFNIYYINKTCSDTANIIVLI